MSVFGDLLEAIPAYTGLSPAAFFTVLVLGYALWSLINSWFAPPPRPYNPPPPPPPPVEVGEISDEELRGYDGKDEGKPLLMAIKGQIYDVTRSRGFYGPGGPYELFAGKDASRALAKMSFEAEDLNGNLEGLSPYELEALSDWEYKFMSKYVKVGQVKKAPTGVEEESREAEQPQLQSEDATDHHESAKQNVEDN